MRATSKTRRPLPLLLAAAVGIGVPVTLAAGTSASAGAPTTAAPAVAAPPSAQTSPALVRRVPVVPERPVANESFVSPLIETFGNVSIGQHSFVASNTILRADPGGRVCLGNNTNVQDNVEMLALRSGARRPGKTFCGALSATAASRTSIAHQATIENSAVGDFAFVGFRSVIRDATIGSGSFVLHGAVVDGVRVPPNRIVPIGARINTQEQANALATVTAAQNEFKEDVLEVNEEFAESYAELYEESGYDAVTGVSVQPVTSFNRRPVRPSLAPGTRLSTFTRIVGDVRVGPGSGFGRRTSVRADEGAPIVFGREADVEDRVTFHALKGTSIQIGDRFTAEDNIVIHGPLKVGNDVTVRDDAIVFRSTVGGGVEVGEGAIVVDVTLRDGAAVPAGAVITTQAQADALKTR